MCISNDKRIIAEKDWRSLRFVGLSCIETPWNWQGFGRDNAGELARVDRMERANDDGREKVILEVVYGCLYWFIWNICLIFYDTGWHSLVMSSQQIDRKSLCVMLYQMTLCYWSHRCRSLSIQSFMLGLACVLRVCEITKTKSMYMREHVIWYSKQS